MSDLLGLSVKYYYMKFFAVALLLGSSLFAGEEHGSTKEFKHLQLPSTAVLFRSDSTFTPLADFLNTTDLHRLCYVASSCFAAEGSIDNSVVKYCFKDARVLLADNSWHNWALIRNNPEKIAQITAFQNSHVLALDPNLPEEKWHLLWRDELMNAATTTAEPAYLQSFSKKIAENLRKSQKLKGPATTLQETQKLALTILFTMHAYNHNAWYDTLAASKIALSRTLIDTSHDTLNAAKNAAWNEARIAADHAVSKAARSELWVPPRGDLTPDFWKTTWKATWKAFEDATCDATCHALKAEATDDVTQLSKFSWRAAELAAHIYYLRHFDEMLSVMEKGALYYASRSGFAPENSWESFEQEHFGHLRPEARHFLQPWLDAIDRLMRPESKASS